MIHIVISYLNFQIINSAVKTPINKRDRLDLTRLRGVSLSPYRMAHSMCHPTTLGSPSPGRGRRRSIMGACLIHDGTNRSSEPNTVANWELKWG